MPALLMLQGRWSVNIRKVVARASHVQNAVACDSRTRQTESSLGAAVAAWSSVLVAGPARGGIPTGVEPERLCMP